MIAESGGVPDSESLGLTDYAEVRNLQLRRQAQVIAGESDEIIYLTEHRAVYTLGRHGNADNLLRLPQGVECVRIERGGDITYHAPGQLVVYPIIDLRRRRLGVKDYVNALEEWVIRTLALYGIRGERSEGAPGVWLDVGTPRERKICALGVKVTHGVTMHGFALNANIDLTGFRNINPCGFADKGVTSIAVETGESIDMAQLARRILRNIPSRLRRHPQHDS